MILAVKEVVNLLPVCGVGKGILLPTLNGSTILIPSFSHIRFLYGANHASIHVKLPEVEAICNLDRYHLYAEIVILIFFKWCYIT